MPKADEVLNREIPTNWATTNSRSTAHLQDEILKILPSVREIFCQFTGNPNYQVEITGGQEWGHGFFSRHHTGFAVDLRTKNLPGGPRGQIARQICDAVNNQLGEKYFAQLEGPEAPHLHIEFKLGTRVSNPVDLESPTGKTNNLG